MKDEDFLDDLIGDDEDMIPSSSDEEVIKPNKKKIKKQYFNSPNKLNLIKFNFNKLPIILITVLICVVVIFSGMFIIKREIISSGRVGSKAVKLLYEFDSIDELEDNLVKLRSMMTDRCYYSVTVLNSDKSLNTYLKFKKEKTKVNILDSKPGFILYSIDNPNISSDRLFIFSYRLNGSGEIEEVREFEAIDFYSTSDKVIDEEELDKYIEQWNSEE